MRKCAYCIDTNSLMDVWNRYYPIDIFPGLWGNIEQLIDSGVMVSPEEVLKELDKKDDDLSRWAKGKAGFFVPFDAEQQPHLVTVMTEHELLVKNSKRANAADPFVIALAKSRTLTVITQEKLTGSTTKPRIPDVCDAMDIQCMTIVEMVRHEQWRY